MVTAAHTAAIVLLVMLAGVTRETQGCVSREPTPATGPGPHDYGFAVPSTTLWKDGDAGEPLFLRARVIDTCGKPVASARVQVLHANHHGDHEPDRFRGVFASNERGEFELVTVYPGYAGSIARHIHFNITHADHAELVTRLFFKNDPAVDQSIEDLAVVVEEIRRGDGRGWVASFEFVLRPR